MKTFEELGLTKELLDVIHQKGFTEPTEIQEKAIPLALSGKDIIGGSATGSGKTLAFGAAIIENLQSNGNVQALILTPTRELAEQVAETLEEFSKNKHLTITSVFGGVGIEPQIKRLRHTDVVVGTPGRILDHLERHTLSLRNIKFLVLDEVDRMFDMGFRDDVEKILRQCSPERQTMLFSATISRDIDYLARKHTRNAVEIAVKNQVDPSKLTQVYYDVPANMKFSLLVHLLKNEQGDLVMVFCNTRRIVDFVERNLRRVGLNSIAIHGGLTQNRRSRVLEEFHGKGTKILICTDVAGRGLDIKGVSHVYNYDIPSVSSDYIHRIGRTARAGQEGKAINIISDRDYESFKNVLNRENVHVKPEDLPAFEQVQIETNYGSGFDRGRHFGGRNRPSRGSYRPHRREGGYSRGSREERNEEGRRHSYGDRRPSRDFRRGPSHSHRHSF
ncbi:putative ATP-dependent RNA helicase [uncultured archaeon]|nr:putative ATP-dependent RNA helicase [uncultured archaeon]